MLAARSAAERDAWIRLIDHAKLPHPKGALPTPGSRAPLTSGRRVGEKLGGGSPALESPEPAL